MCVGLSVSRSPSLPVSLSLSLAVSLGLTHRAQRIVRFPHKVFIQPLEYELGHSLKRGRAGPGGTELAGRFTGRQSSGARFSAIDFVGPGRNSEVGTPGRGLRLATQGAALRRGLPRWTERRAGTRGGALDSRGLRGSPRCWLRERWTPPCVVYPAGPGAAAAAAPGSARARGTRCRWEVGTGGVGSGSPWALPVRPRTEAPLSPLIPHPRCPLSP